LTDTADVTEPATAHTAWCDPAECATDETGLHWSAPWTIGSNDPSDIHPSLTIHITQHRSGPGPTRDDAPPLIDVTVHTQPADDTDTEDPDYTLLLTPERAIALGHILITAGQAAMRGGPAR
jgi:hypothetical protein